MFIHCVVVMKGGGVCREKKHFVPIHKNLFNAVNLGIFTWGLIRSGAKDCGFWHFHVGLFFSHRLPVDY